MKKRMKVFFAVAPRVDLCEFCFLATIDYTELVLHSCGAHLVWLHETEFKRENLKKTHRQMLKEFRRAAGGED